MAARDSYEEQQKRLQDFFDAVSTPESSVDSFADDGRRCKNDKQNPTTEIVGSMTTGREQPEKEFDMDDHGNKIVQKTSTRVDAQCITDYPEKIKDAASSNIFKHRLMSWLLERVLQLRYIMRYNNLGFGTIIPLNSDPTRMPSVGIMDINLHEINANNALIRRRPAFSSGPVQAVEEVEKLRSATRFGRAKVLIREFASDVYALWRYGAPFPTFLKLIATIILCMIVILPLAYPVFVALATYYTFEGLFLSWWLNDPRRFLPLSILRRVVSAIFRPIRRPDMWKVREVFTRGILLAHSLATSVDYLCVMQGLLDESIALRIPMEPHGIMAQYAIIGVLALCHTSLAYTKFPEAFTFGVATAAHQIEGAWNVSGKTENVWDRLSHTRPWMIADATNGDIACDSYHRYREDVEELAYLGVDFYRFSLSWSRILPTGRTDFINPDGIRYYNDLLDALAEKNIEPLVTLFHWDLPQSLQDLGGWANPKMIDYFRDYSNVCFKEFGDKIKSWITFNEPYEICEDAYGDDKKAPAIDSHGVGNYLCSDTLLKAHAEAFHLYNETYRSTQLGRIMISINSIWYEPSDPEQPEQVALAEVANQFKFGWFAHPIFTTEGGYPAVMVENVRQQSEAEGLSKPRLEQFDAYWTERIRGTSDFLGINHYTTHLVVGSGVDPIAKSPSWLKDIGAISSMDVGGNSASEWLRVVPVGFANLLRWCKSTYNNPPIYITENGFSDRGEIMDYGRIKYFNDYLSVILEVINDDGVNVLGYTAWTLMDNFEWRAGFSERFGFYHVDITDPNRPRTPKLSVEYYKELTSTRALPQDPRFFQPSARN